jgi:hypothetical protein
MPGIYKPSARILFANLCQDLCTNPNARASRGPLRQGEAGWRPRVSFSRRYTVLIPELNFPLPSPKDTASSSTPRDSWDRCRSYSTRAVSCRWKRIGSIYYLWSEAGLSAKASARYISGIGATPLGQTNMQWSVSSSRYMSLRHRLALIWLYLHINLSTDRRKPRFLVFPIGNLL